MALQYVEPPAEVVDVARAGLRRVSESGVASSPDLRRVPTDRLHLTHPQPVYLLGLDDLRAGYALEAAKPSGWRYLVEADEPDARPLALAESVTGPDGAQEFAHLNYGPFVAGTAEAMRAAEQMTLPDAHVRVLHIPALYLIALWFQHDHDATLIPVAPAPPGIEANRSYTARELFDLLSELARRLPDLDAADDRGT